MRRARAALGSGRRANRSGPRPGPALAAGRSPGSYSAGMRRPRLAAALVAALSLAAGPASAAGRCVPGLEGTEIDARLDYLEASLLRAESPSLVWYWSWLGTAGLLTVGQGVAAIAVPEDSGFRGPLLVGAASALLLASNLALRPLSGAWARDRLEAFGGSDRPSRLRRLAEAEHLLEDAARREAHHASWLVHFVGAGWSVAAGVFAGAVIDSPPSGVAVFLGSAIATEASTLTVPHLASRRWEAYRREFRRRACVEVAEAPAPSWSVGPAGAGLGLRVEF